MKIDHHRKAARLPKPAGSRRNTELHYYFKCYSAALLNSPSQEKSWGDKKLTFSEAAAEDRAGGEDAAVPAWHAGTPSWPDTHGYACPHRLGGQGIAVNWSQAGDACPGQSGPAAASRPAPSPPHPSALPSLITYSLPGWGTQWLRMSPSSGFTVQWGHPGHELLTGLCV